MAAGRGRRLPRPRAARADHDGDPRRRHPAVRLDERAARPADAAHRRRVGRPRLARAPSSGSRRARPGRRGRRRGHRQARGDDHDDAARRRRSTPSRTGPRSPARRWPTRPTSGRLIETKLRRGLARKIEADIATLLNGATLQTAVERRPDARHPRSASALVEAAGYSPNAVAAQPGRLRRARHRRVPRDANTGPDPAPTFWGLTPIPVADASRPASAIVGDFKEGVTLFDRGVADVFVTDSPRRLLHQEHPRDPRRGSLQVGHHRPARARRDGGRLPCYVARRRLPRRSPTIRAWLKVAATVLPDDELEVIAGAEQSAQTHLLEWPDGDAPDDVVAAFYPPLRPPRRGQGHPARHPRRRRRVRRRPAVAWESEVDRLEAPYFIPVIA